MVRADLAGRFDPAPVREPDVHHHDIRSCAIRFVDGLADRVGLHRDVDVFLSLRIRRIPLRTTS